MLLLLVLVKLSFGNVGDTVVDAVVGVVSSECVVVSCVVVVVVAVAVIAVSWCVVVDITVDMYIIVIVSLL